MTGRPVLLFDGDCGFCGRSIEVLRRTVRPRVDLVPWQCADLAALGVTEDRADREVLWISPAGTVLGGPRALSAVLMSGRRRWWGLGLVLRLPPVAWPARGVYRVIAKNRHRMPGGTSACSLPAAMRGKPAR
ncbi:DUF393 domain-containing protein [Streptomyces sp. NPDC053755]|uniref:thiol-disulfide oxidoreductase DCC family protein n=1 Tax=Streptomyces sp. NPDC053755 TaxID=3155815 RepID=UPI00342B0747